MENLFGDIFKFKIGEISEARTKNADDCMAASNTSSLQKEEVLAEEKSVSITRKPKQTKTKPKRKER